MFSSGPSYNKLKTNLRLAINRLKLSPSQQQDAKPPLPKTPPKSAPSPDDTLNLPELPAVPVNSFGNLGGTIGGGSTATGGEDVDFDDLTKRFEELKKKK